MATAADNVSLKQPALKSLYDDPCAKSKFPFWAAWQGAEHGGIKRLMATANAIPLV